MDRLEVVEQVVSCTNCELHKVGSGPIPFSGPKENPNGIAIIGEAPGRQEDEKGEPFIGPAGQLLRKHLTEAGITPERCFIINTASCFPNGTPKPEHVQACAGNKAAQLAIASPRWVLVLGKVAMEGVRPGLKISAARGRPFMKGNVLYMVTYHPAAALRKGTYETQMRQDIELFLEVCKAGNDWSKFVSDTCWECGSDEVAWFDRDLVCWCEKHAPKAFHDRMAFIQKDYEEACARLAGPTEPLSDPVENQVALPGKPTDTQWGAAMSAFPRSGTQRMGVLEFIAKAVDGATDEEVRIALGSQWTSGGLDTRRLELQRGGWVKDSGSRRKTKSGADAIVWVLTTEGAAEWRKRG